MNREAGSDMAASIIPTSVKVSDLLVRYQEQIEGQLPCFDRVIFQGTLVEVAHPGALASYLVKSGRKPSDLVRTAVGDRLFDFVGEDLGYARRPPRFSRERQRLVHIAASRW